MQATSLPTRELLPRRCPNPECGSPNFSTKTIKLVYERGNTVNSATQTYNLYWFWMAVFHVFLFCLFGVLVWFGIANLIGSDLTLLLGGVYVVSSIIYMVQYITNFANRDKLLLFVHRCKSCKLVWNNFEQSPLRSAKTKGWRQGNLLYFQHHKDYSGVAESLCGLTICELNEGNSLLALSLARDGLWVAENQSHKKLLIASGQNALSWIMLFTGDYNEAEPLIQQSMTGLNESKDWMLLGSSIHSMGLLRLFQGRYAEAQSYFLDRFKRSVQMGEPEFMAWDLEGLAGVAEGQQQFTLAAFLYGAAQAFREDCRIPLPIYYRPFYDRSVAAIRAQLAAQVFDAYWSQGRNAQPAMVAELVLRQTAPK